MADMKEFLNPKAMLTPGVAGAVTMLIGNSVWVAFGVPPPWTALLVSFLFGLLVLAGTGIPGWQRAIYYVLNSLIIFSMAVGSNTVSVGVGRPAEVRQAALLDLKLGVPPAYAQPRDAPQPGRELRRQREELERREEEVRRREQELQRKLEEQQKKEKGTPQQRPRQFFDRWF